MRRRRWPTAGRCRCRVRPRTRVTRQGSSTLPDRRGSTGLPVIEVEDLRRGPTERAVPRHVAGKGRRDERRQLIRHPVDRELPPDAPHVVLAIGRSSLPGANRDLADVVGQVLVTLTGSTRRLGHDLDQARARAAGRRDRTTALRGRSTGRGRRGSGSSRSGGRSRSGPWRPMPTTAASWTAPLSARYSLTSHSSTSTVGSGPTDSELVELVGDGVRDRRSSVREESPTAVRRPRTRPRPARSRPGRRHSVRTAHR